MIITTTQGDASSGAGLCYKDPASSCGRAAQLGLDFFDVDLRWGVPARDANGETTNSWKYCRRWIDRVELFFLCIL